MGYKLHFHDIASFTRTRFNRNIMGCKAACKRYTKLERWYRFNRNIMGYKDTTSYAVCNHRCDLIGT